MAFSYGFFNAKNLDRVYTAEDFTSYLSSLICNGILDTYGDCFAITANNDLTVTIGSGKAWIGGHYFINDASYTIDLQRYVDESLSRYVTIGISCDVSDNARECKLEVLQGTASTGASIPTFESTDTKTFLTLGAVKLVGGATSISDQDITDYRSDDTKCGFCKCILGKCRVTEMQEEIKEILADIAQLQEDISGVESGSITSRLNIVEGRAEYVNNAVDSALSRLDTIEHTTIPALESRIEALEQA